MCCYHTSWYLLTKDAKIVLIYYMRIYHSLLSRLKPFVCIMRALNLVLVDSFDSYVRTFLSA